MKKLALSLLFTLVSAPLFAFPHVQRVTAEEAKELTATRQTFDFEGIVALSGCSGSLVRFEDSLDSDPGLILTNGHCVRLLDPGVVLSQQTVSRSFDILSPSAKKLGTVRSTRLLYATMTKTDMALYQLRETYADILNKFNTRALTLSSLAPVPGTSIEVISGYWKRGYACAVETIVDKLKEGNWLFEGSLRYSRPGCAVIGGTSGSPVIEAGTRTVIAVNNTINESGKSCQVNNPCEVLEDGSVFYEKGIGYAQQTHWIYTCRNELGAIDLEQNGCLLPKPSTPR